MRPISKQSRKTITGALVLSLGAPVFWTIVGAATVTKLEHSLRGLGAWAEVTYVAMSALAIMLCAPACLFYLMAGLLFGVTNGTLLGSAAGMLGSAGAFFVARSVLGQRAAQQLARSSRLDRFERALSERPLWLMLIMRLSQFVPIGPLSYALGLSRVSTRSFLVTSPALFPIVVTYAYAGDIARDALDASHHAREPWEWGLVGLGLTATIGAAILVGRATTRALAPKPAAASSGSVPQPSAPWLTPTPSARGTR
ncbi:MAG: VTT domain-containing protein [Polyangiales bacterium]